MSKIIVYIFLKAFYTVSDLFSARQWCWSSQHLQTNTNKTSKSWHGKYTNSRQWEFFLTIMVLERLY
jgi:hypothetical protein